MKKIILPLILIAMIAIVFLLTMNKTEKADMLLVNGKVYTFDVSNSITEAVAIQGDRIIGTGTTNDITKRFRSEKIIDLKGKTVLPGLIDGHAHILGEGGRLEIIDLVGTTSPEQIAGMVGEKLKIIKAGDWILGRGWDQNDWNVKKFPAKELLDNICPENPVLLRRVDGHAAWVNSKTLRLTGINAGTTEPAGGKIYRDKNGDPTGILLDNAVDLVNSVIPELSEDETERRLKLAMEECARLGLTEVHDMGVDLQTIKIYKKLIDKGECPIRIYAAIDYPSETWNTYLAQGPEINYGNGFLTIRAVKLYMDGALGSRGAAMVESYSDDPGNRGLTMMSESQIDSVCRDAFGKDFQVCTHAIGDRANNLVLNAYENATLGAKVSGDSLRWRIEHAQILLPGDINRFKQLAIVPAMQPTHATSDMGWAEARLGPERVKGAYAWRSILNSGSIIISGSDFPVESVNPLFGIYAAITRQDKNGNPYNGWYSDQKMTRDEAVRSFTQWAAYGAFQETMKGTIEVGKWADLTILSNDIMRIPSEEILSTEIEMTIVGGKFSFSKL